MLIKSNKLVKFWEIQQNKNKKLKAEEKLIFLRKE